jgi:alkyl hydroperoxide reductase subunit AhpC
VASVGELKALTRKYPREQLVLVSISADESEATWRQFVEKNGMDWPQSWDRDGSVRRAFDVHAYPTYLLIDPDGIIREQIVGLSEQATIATRLKRALAEIDPGKRNSAR